MNEKDFQPDSVHHVLGEQALAEIHQLAIRAQQAQDVPQLGFTMVNETLSLFAYRQAMFFSIQTEASKPKLISASGLVSVSQDSPFTVWLGRLVRTLPTAQTGTHTLHLDQAPADLQEGWAEWLPEHLAHIALESPSGKVLGCLLFARELPWTGTDLAALALLSRHYAYCLSNLGASRRHLMAPLAILPKGKLMRWLLPALALILLIPVRLSSLAPAEVVPLSTVAVAAPQDGVIARVHILPNTLVKKGTLLLSLDDTTLRSRLDVVNKALAVAQAEALTVQQRAFDEVKSKGDLASILGRVREKESEVAQVQAAMTRLSVMAERDGIAMFNDADEWVGRPVQTGERIMELADPKQAGVLVWLPTNDALNLTPGAPMRLFLHTQPLEPLSALLTQTSYQAVLSPDGVASYRLKGQFNQNDAPPPRIGLRGTVRVSGQWALLGYYIFRRPLSALREWTGL